MVVYMSHELSLQECQQKWHGSLKAYLYGFFGSIVLTGISFSLVVFHVLSGSALIYTLVGLALVQATVQLLFFLHLGQEEKPKTETMVFCFMLLILSIIAIGTLWVMHDLNERMMPKMKTDKEMHHHD